MTVNEMIKKWNICLCDKGYLRVFWNSTPEQEKEIRSAKPAIVKELKRRRVAKIVEANRETNRKV